MAVEDEMPVLNRYRKAHEKRELQMKAEAFHEQSD